MHLNGSNPLPAAKSPEMEAVSKNCVDHDHDHQDDGGGDDPGDGEEKVTAMMTNDQ